MKLQELIDIVTFFTINNHIDFYILHGNDSHDGHPDSSPMNLLKPLKHVWMSCYAAGKVFSPDESMFVACEQGKDHVEIVEHARQCIPSNYK